MTFIAKPTTSFSSISKPSSTQSPKIDRISSTINSISDTINGYVAGIYDSVSKPATNYSQITKPS